MSFFFFFYPRQQCDVKRHFLLTKLCGTPLAYFCLLFTHTSRSFSAVPQTTGCVRAQDDHSLRLRLHLTHQKVDRISLPAPADCHGCSSFFLLLFFLSLTNVHALSLGTVRGDVASQALWSAPLPGTKLYSFIFREKGEMHTEIKGWVENRVIVIC